MPEWAQWLAQLNPLKHFIAVMRAIMLKGAGIVDIARELVVLAAFGVITLSLALRQYRRQTA
jgi:ABC-2 type transport system permease protein